jgi:outer membrane receptor protein involved in Fe transport
MVGSVSDMSQINKIVFLLFLFFSTSVISAEGILKLFVFEDGIPFENVEVHIRKGSVSLTNKDGAVEVKLTVGSHIVRVKKGNKNLAVIKFKIAPEETTQIIVSLTQGEKNAKVDIEHPEHKISQSGKIKRGEIKELKKGFLKGKITSLEDKTPVDGARVFIRGWDQDTITDNKGEFIIEIPEGEWAISVIHPQFSTQTNDNIIVEEGKETLEVIELTPASIELEEFIVLQPHIEGGIASLTEERRESSAVVDVIGAEQMSKSGDSDAAAALRRVTGITVVGGRYVFVRGMGDRYSTSLLNGAFLSSPEPENRIVPLDLFPTGVLESMEIQKTFSPDIPAEFGGGMIKLKTKGVPEEFFFNISFSMGFDGDTFKKRMSSQGGKTDWLGIDDGSRALPDLIKKETAGGKKLVEKSKYQSEGFTAEDIQAMGRSMPNSWKIGTATNLPSMNGSFSFGDRFRFENINFGYMMGGSYSNGIDIVSDKLTRNIVSGTGGELVINDEYRFNSATNTILMSGIGGLGLEIGENHKFSTTTLLVRITDDNITDYSGRFGEISGDIRVRQTQWVERMLFFQQIKGEHKFPWLFDIGFDWFYAFSQADRDEPDRRLTIHNYIDSTDSWEISTFAKSNERVYSQLNDVNHNLGTDLTIPFKWWSSLENKIKAGFSMLLKDRSVDTRRFAFQNVGRMSPDERALPPEEFFAEENIASGKLYLNETTRPTDNYTANQKLFSFYLMTDLQIIESLLFSGGLRYEDSDQYAKTFELYTSEPSEVIAPLHTKDFMPAAILTWKFYKDMQIRTGYGLTVNRPDLRELSPALSSSIDGGSDTIGNENLKRALIHNFDARAEWYFSAMESISFAFFYKKFKDPIEMVYLTGSDPVKRPQNVNEAQNIGVEFEFRKNFEFITDVLEDLYLAGNFSYIKSEVDTGIKGKRPLQGQSPWIVNLQLGYDNTDIGTTAAILYNAYGKRISEIGGVSNPDIYEQPYHQLDLVVSQNLPLDFSIRLRLRNLLNLKSEKYMGDVLKESYNRGRDFTVSLSWKY